jgi:putative flippase GtrA
MKQVALFLLAGGFAAVVNVASRIFYSLALPLPAAVVLAYVTGMAVAFSLNRRFVFDNARDDVARRAGRFVMVNLFAVLQTLAVTLVGAWALRKGGAGDVSETIAHVVGVLVPVFSSFLLHRQWTFARRFERQLSEAQSTWNPGTQAQGQEFRGNNLPSASAPVDSHAEALDRKSIHRPTGNPST